MGLVPRRLRACVAVLILSMLSPSLAHAADGGDAQAKGVAVRASARSGDSGQSCRRGDRGRLLGFDRVASPRKAGPPSSALFAGGGLIYVAPDYLGLGGSSVPRHRYFHAATEASSAADLLAASGDVLRRLRVRRSDELFTFGFSQGGHAALALQRALERRRVDVTATATVGGVLDVERFFLSSIADETTVTPPLYVAYILLAYDDVYDIYARPADVYRRPHPSTVPGLFDMEHFFDDVLAGLPPTSRELLRASYFRAVSGNPDHPLRVRLRENAVDRWRPDAPIGVYHSPDDEEVFFGDMLVSVARLRSRGADVTVKSLPGVDHVNSWIQARPRAAEYFKTLD